MPPRHGLSPDAAKAMAYWGIVELAAESHATTADLWSWIRDAADELGLASPGVTVRGIQELRGRAGQIQAAKDKFAKLADNQRVRGEHIATPPWARDPSLMRAQPKFAVRFRHTVIRNGIEQTEWKTSVFPGKVTHTAGRLRADVELDAQNLANKYETEHVGISDLQILEF